MDTEHLIFHKINVMCGSQLMDTNTRYAVSYGILINEFLGAFVKLKKAIINFVMSVRLSA